MGDLINTVLSTENLSHLSDIPQLVVSLMLIFDSKDVISWRTNEAEELKVLRLETVGSEAIVKLLLVA